MIQQKCKFSFPKIQIYILFFNKYKFITKQQMSMITISKLLNQLEKPNHNPFDQTTNLEPDLAQLQNQLYEDHGLFKSLEYFANRSALNQRQSGSFSWEEIIQQDTIIQSAQIQKIYSTICARIVKAKYFFEQSSVVQNEENNQLMDQYLELKALAFHLLYLPQSPLNDVFGDSKRGFQVDRLKLLCEQMNEIKRKLLKIVSNISEQNRWMIKLQGLYLLHQITKLIGQLVKAAYPFVQESKIIKIITIPIPISSLEFDKVEKQITEEQNQLRILDLKRRKQFEAFLCEKQKPFIEKGLCLIQNKMLELEQQIKQNPVQAEMNDDFGLRHLNGMAQQIINMNKIRSIELMFRLQCYVYKNYDLEEANFISVFNKLMLEDPSIIYTNEQLKVIATCYEYQPLNAEMYINYHYKLIHKLKNTNLEMNLKNWSNLLEKFLILLGKSLTFCKHEKNLLLQYENYFELLKLIKTEELKIEIDDGLARGHFQEYLVLLGKNIGIEVFKVKMEMRRIDESFTYKLLINSKIIKHLEEYQKLFHSSLSKIVPIMLLSTKIKAVRSYIEGNESVNLFEIIQRFQYISLLKQRNLQNLNKNYSKSKRKQKQSNILDKILEICRQNHGLTEQIPHILQFRHILMLFEVLKTKKRKTRSYEQGSYIDFKYLQEMAFYFSADRKCSIYQLKSKILLFITLFKMGHYIPRIKQGNDVVNLRQRIINLMIKQAHNSNSTILTPSRINRESLSSIIVYNNQDILINKISTILNCQQSQMVQIRASQQLSDNIRQYINDVSSKQDGNWIQFITQRMNMLQHELFLDEKKVIKLEQQYLSEQYVEHIKNCLIQRKNLQNIYIKQFECFINIQRYFFLQKYEKGWELLHKQKQTNNCFDIFMDKVLASTNYSIQVFKFLKIYKHYQKIQTLIAPAMQKGSQFLESKEQIKKIVEALNENGIIDVQQQAIQALIIVSLKNKQIKELQGMIKNQIQNQNSSIDFSILSPDSIFSSKPFNNNKYVDQSNQGSTLDFNAGTKNIKPNEMAPLPQKPQQFPEKKEILSNQSCLMPVKRLQSFQGISVTTKQGNIFSIKIGKIYSKFHRDIQDQMKYFKIVLRKGINKIKTIFYQSGSKWKQSLVIDFEQSRYDIQNSKHSSLKENLQQKMMKAFLDRLAELMKILLMNQESIRIDFEEEDVIFDFKGRTISLNPYFLILQKIMNKVTNNSKKNVNLFESINNIISPFRSKFSKQFEYNYSILQKALRYQQFFTNKTLSNIYNSTLLLSLSQKTQTILDFQQKMGNIYRKFNVFSTYPKNSTLLLKKRMELMLDMSVKNYTYYFKIGGVIQQQAIEQQICQIYDKKGSPAVFIWYDQKNDSDDLFDFNNMKDKQYRFSFQQFIRKLKKAIIESSQKQKVITKILQRFPKLIQFLKTKISLLTQSYDSSMKSKNKWLYHTLNNPSIQGKIKQAIISCPELANKMERYQVHFRENILNLFHKNNLQILYSCTKCQSVFKLIQTMNKNEIFLIVDMLHEVTKLFPKVGSGQVDACGILSDEHNASKCFLNEKLMTHPGVVILGKEMTRPLPKYFVTVNWWFYLQCSYPLLVDILTEAYKQVIRN